MTSKSPRISFQTAWPQALEKHTQILFNFCEVTAEGYICLHQCLTSFALIYLDSALPLFTSRCNFSNSLLRGVYMTQGRLSLRSEFTPVPSYGSTFVYLIPPQNVMPAWVHPGFCTGARISPWYVISQRYHVNAKRPPVSVWNRSAGRLERVAHA